MSTKTTKKPGKSLIPWEQEVANAAKKQSQAPKTGGGDRVYISTKGGIMMVGDRKVTGNKLDAVILDFAYVNAYYDKAYNPKELSSPKCFALDRVKDKLAPHKDAEEAQSELCATCPNNEWGSKGDGGNGKACGNKLRVSLIPASDLGKNIADADIVYLMLPPTSVKGFGAFYKEECCDEEGDPVKPTYMFTTTVELQPDANTQFKILFSRPDNTNVSKEQFYALRDKVTKLADDILFPFAKLEDMPKRKPVASKVAKKAKY